MRICEAGKTISGASQIDRVEHAQSAFEIFALLREMGVEHVLWQLRLKDELRTWDGLPAGFLEHYYGHQMDQPCAIAEAIRQHWQYFTFAEARATFNRRPHALDAEREWQAFNINDGAVFYSGRAAERSTMVLCSSGPIAPILHNRETIFVSAAWKLHHLLADDPTLISVSRNLAQLSPKQHEALSVQIDNPELTLSEQAKLLNISRRMLEKRHNQVAAKFAVSSFTSAVMMAVKR